MHKLWEEGGILRVICSVFILNVIWCKCDVNASFSSEDVRNVRCIHVNVTMNKLTFLMDIVQVGNNDTVFKWLVFALELTDLIKIISSSPAVVIVLSFT